MNIGIRLHDTEPGTLEERLGFARKQGFSCVHLALSKVLPEFAMADAPRLLTDELAVRVREGLAANGLACPVLGCYLKLAGAEGEALERTQEIYRAHLRFARKIGASAVGTETPPAAGYDGDVRSEEALQRFVEAAKPLVRCAEEEGAILAIEPVVSHVVCDPERMERALDALGSDSVRVILDAVNLLTRETCGEAEAIIEACIRRFGDRICVLHMKDYVVDPAQRRPVACACGTGGMRFEELLRFARERELPMTLENTRPEDAEAARLYLEALAGGLER